MGREQTSNSNLVESSATTRGGDGLGTPYLPTLPIKPMSSLFHVFNQNSFNEGTMYS